MAVILALWLLGIAPSAMAFRAQYRRSPGLQAWNLASALIYTALVPVTALDGDWIGTGLAVPLLLLRWMLWWRGPRRGRKARGFG